jgi:alpha-tubulin suppressor-like RCC1 family protein
MDRPSPATVTGLREIRALSVGITHACALGGDGQVRCWGDNDEGQLGEGTSAARLVPTEASQARDLGTVAGVAVVSWRPHRTVLTSHTGTLVWTDEGEVWVWGEEP